VAGDKASSGSEVGHRALAFKARKEVRLISGNQINFGNDYPQFIDFLKFRGEITPRDTAESSA
jgi:hypothetical protein